MSVLFTKTMVNYLNLPMTNEKVLELLTHYNGKLINPLKIATCAITIGAVLAVNGYKNTNSAMARSYLKWGIPVKPENAQEGDIVVKRRGLYPFGHVGFFICWVDKRGKKCQYKNADAFRLLGGNQDKMIKVKDYPLNTLLGIRREGK